MPLSQKEYELIQHFAQYISAHKKEFVEKVLLERTRHITIVLEDIHQSQNASAAVRTCECMGIQDIHIIENSSSYGVNKKVLKGSNKWVNLIRYKMPDRDNTTRCFQDLQKKGYTIYATDPVADISIDDIPIKPDHRVALVFGNELNGLSPDALLEAHHRVKIPMYGFTESMNISASVAACLNTVIPKIKRDMKSFRLSAGDMDELRLLWYRKIVRRSEVIEKEFLKSNP